MKAWLMYAGAGLVLMVVGAWVGTMVVSPLSRGAIWLSAGIAWVVQLATFGALVAVRTRNELFLAGWLIGMIARFGVVGVVAWWLTRSETYPREATLVSLVAFVFVLLLLEPLFLRRGMQAR